MIRLQSEPIVLDALIAEAQGDADGAIASFLGAVRNHHGGRPVVRLEYHAYPEMAESEMRALESEARERFSISSVCLAHRTGRLEIGEVSVAVVVAAPHRAPALEACRWIIDTLKQRVPIWKKEFFEDGEEWVDGSAGS